MLDWWEHNGPPTYIAAAGYLGLIKPRKPKPQAQQNPYPPRALPKPEQEPAKPKGQGDLNDLVGLFRNMGSGFSVG